MKVSELTGAELDYWVAKAEGIEIVSSSGKPRAGLMVLDHGTLYPVDLGPVESTESDPAPYSPSRRWEQAGLIIERERIRLMSDSLGWRAMTQLHVVQHERDAPCWSCDGPTPLIAAMRAYVASKFGAAIGQER